MGWVKSMPGDFGEFSVNIGLGINFLAGGTLFFNSNDTLSYRLFVKKFNIGQKTRQFHRFFMFGLDT